MADHVSDATYHAGGGEWTKVITQALLYPTRGAAEQGIDEVDEWAVLRGQLVVEEVR